MTDEARVAFLKWCLPRLDLRWPGYRKVRRLVGKRLNRRLAELGLVDLSAYRDFLASHPSEWARLDALCRIPISRFYRDRGVFDAVSQRLLPEIATLAAARGDESVACWSAGCASGEEPYTLALAWHFHIAPHWPGLPFSVVASDAEAAMVERAKTACYGAGSLKDLPAEWRERAFTQRGALFCLAAEFRRNVQFLVQDIRQSMPRGPFDLILCRNLVFTYFDEALQRRLVGELWERLLPSGFLVIGSHESLPRDVAGFAPVAAMLPIYRRGPQ
jgi:chemotaxis protein methyltransferase CheR